MRHVQVDVALLMIVGLRHHDDFLRPLDDEDRLKAALERPARNAARPAALPRAKSRLAGKDFFVALAQGFARPGLKDGIGKIGDGKGGLLSGDAELVVVDRRMLRIVGNRPGTAWRWLQSAQSVHPRRVRVGRKVRRSRARSGKRNA